MNFIYTKDENSKACLTKLGYKLIKDQNCVAVFVNKFPGNCSAVFAELGSGFSKNNIFFTNTLTF
jgi:16S rRNA C1402 (ribose-2'-O) methylase RsmI